MPGLIPVVSAVVTALLLAGCQPDVAHEPDSLAPVIQLRLARETPAPGFVYMDAPPPDTGIYVDERVVVSDEQIAYVRVERRGNDVLLDVRLTPDGAARLAAVTSENIGGRLATLLDSRVVSAGVIMNPIGSPDRSIGMGGLDLPQGVADEIAAAVVARWPP